MKRKLLALLLLVCLSLPVIPASAQTTGGSYTYDCYSLQDVVSAVYTSSYYLADSVTLRCSSSLDWAFTDTYTISTILYNNGFLNWNLYSNKEGSMHTYTISNIVYLSGFRIARLVSLGQESQIQDNKERAILSTARGIVDKAQSNGNTTLEVERYLHDWLCLNVNYQNADNINSPENTAIGALYYGKAECDGYSDAFYLLCSLAGIPVSFLRGTTDGNTGYHIWNIVYIKDTWVQVDVTWDDLEYDANPKFYAKYVYFNTGGEMIANHHWNDKLTFFQVYPYTNWNAFFYTSGQSGEKNTGGYFQDLTSAAKFVVQQKKAGRRSAHVMVDGTYSDAERFHETLAQCGLHGRWRTWYENGSKYTCFDVYFE